MGPTYLVPSKGSNRMPNKTLSLKWFQPHLIPKELEDNRLPFILTVSRHIIQYLLQRLWRNMTERRSAIFCFKYPGTSFVFPLSVRPSPWYINAKGMLKDANVASYRKRTSCVGLPNCLCGYPDHTKRSNVISKRHIPGFVYIIHGPLELKTIPTTVLTWRGEN